MSKKFGIFCNESGETQCGSDKVLRLDARNDTATQVQDMRQRREAFKKNFPHKYDQFSHCMLVNDLYDESNPIPLG